MSYPHFTRMHGAETWGNRQKLLEVKFCLDVKNILHGDNTQTLEILPSKVLESHLIDILKTWLGVALDNLIQGPAFSERLDLMNYRVFSNLEFSMVLWFFISSILPTVKYPYPDFMPK